MGHRDKEVGVINMVMIVESVKLDVQREKKTSGLGECLLLGNRKKKGELAKENRENYESVTET